jgi:superoxide dismutase, Fe-Mn family
MKHKTPELEYSYGALEPFLDEKTMKIHHTKHHQTYVDKLNAVITKHKRLHKKTPEQLITNNRLPKEDRTVIINNAGGHVNHTFFWKLLRKNTLPKGEIKTEIINTFGNFQSFENKFQEAALNLFGSGWTWLVLNKNKKLEIINTKNQENPISKKKIPLLGLDVWEHAYYLKYKNKRAEYVEAFFNIINWDQVNENYLEALKE